MASNKRQNSSSDVNGSHTKARRTGEYETKGSFIHALTQRTADSPKTDSGVIFFAYKHDLVIDVWKGLIKHNFLSVPVLQKCKNKYYGFLDLGDIVSFVVHNFKPSNPEDKSFESFWDQTRQSSTFLSLRVKDIMKYPLTRRNPFHPVTTGYSLFHAIELMGRERHLHRVPVITKGDERRLLNIITQSQVAKIVRQQSDADIGSVMNMPASSCANKHVVSVSLDTLAIDAFHKLVDESLCGIAVLNAKGQAVSNISVRDLKGLDPNGRVFWRFFETKFTVETFLKLVNEKFSPDRPCSLVTISEKDTLSTALTRLTDNNLHRLYLVDGEGKPTGVISIRDILLQIVDN